MNEIETNELVLSEGQQRVLSMAKAGDNIFISGPGGVGKSVVVREIIEELRVAGKRNVAVTASTGIAALHVGGSTIHSFLGTRIFGNWDAVDRALISGTIDLEGKQAHLIDRMMNIDVLIIDEISMLTGDYLCMIDRWLRYVREEHEAPFGGVQIILSGDFLQLAPVMTHSDEVEYEHAFQSPVWKEAGIKTEMLAKCFRQDDAELIFHLANIRNGGDVNPNTLAYFNQFVGAHKNWPVEPTWLLTHNDEVRKINLQHLAKLPGKQYNLKAFFTGRDNLISILRRNCVAEELLQIKKGALVMILKNDYADKKYVNGTKAIVTQVLDDKVIVSIEGSDGKKQSVILGKNVWEYFDYAGRPLAMMKQFPVKLAYAITIHKSQGMTLDNVHTNLYKCFEKGQAYTALSRVRSAQGLSLDEPLSGREIHTNMDAIEFYKEF